MCKWNVMPFNVRALWEMSIEMSSGYRDVEPEGLVSSVVQLSMGLVGIPNLKDRNMKSLTWKITSQQLDLFMQKKKKKKNQCQISIEENICWCNIWKTTLKYKLWIFRSTYSHGIFKNYIIILSGFLKEWNISIACKLSCICGYAHQRVHVSSKYS